MSANRRGFLGALAAAPVAGPSALKEAALQMAVRNPRPDTFSGGLMSSAGVGPMPTRSSMMEPDDAVRKAFRLGIVTRDQLLEFINGTKLSGGDGMSLDPDLQAAKSFSASTRLRIQRERNRDREIERFLAKPKSMWEFGRELIEKGLVTGDRP